jgi:hypothetical protein
MIERVSVLSPDKSRNRKLTRYQNFLTVDIGPRCVRMCGATSRNITWHPHK